MRFPFVIVLFAASGLAGCGMVGDSSLAKEGADPPAGAPEVFEGPVPRANCGPGSNPETGLQGQVPLVDRESGRSLSPYTCNTELVGNYNEVAAEWQLAWYDDCAYYGTTQAGANGVPVIDASDPSHPVKTTNLRSYAFMDPWESLKVNEKRGLLGGVGGTVGGFGTLYFDLYDVTGDCTRPRLLQSLPIGGVGHEGNWAPDGRTYYAAALFAPEIIAIDTENPNTPKPIVALPYITHGLDVSEDGNRLYLANYLVPDNGLEIYDSSLLNTRTAYPGRVPAVPVLVGSVYWPDGSAAQHPIPLTIQGKPFVLFVDEGGLGMARLIDISDETAPVVVSKLKLEIDMPGDDLNAIRTADASIENESFAYNGHYCGVDSRIEPTIAGCSYFWSGVRFFDIRDPYHPREIGYYNPGGRVETPRGGSSGDGYAGYASAQVRFIKERGEAWFTDQRHGFLIVRFTNGVWPFRD